MRWDLPIVAVVLLALVVFGVLVRQVQRHRVFPSQPKSAPMNDPPGPPSPRRMVEPEGESWREARGGRPADEPRPGEARRPRLVTPPPLDALPPRPRGGADPAPAGPEAVPTPRPAVEDTAVPPVPEPLPGQATAGGPEEPTAPYPGAALARADGSAPSPEYRVKVDLAAKRYYVQDSRFFAAANAQLWFRTVEEAERAGFTSAPE